MKTTEQPEEGKNTEERSENFNIPNLKDFDIQDPDDATPARLAEPETINSWRPTNISEVISIIVMLLLVLWVVVGLFYFIFTGVAWLLVATPILGLPLRRVMDYNLPSRKPVKRRGQRKKGRQR